MIKHTITQTTEKGENIIRIEHAESIEDAESNNFKNGEYSRFFVNDKPVSSYMVLIKYLIEETAKNKKSFIPDRKNLDKIRKELFAKQNSMVKEHLESVKKHYGDFGNSDSIIKNIDKMIEKIDDSGVRVIE